MDLLGTSAVCRAVAAHSTPMPNNNRTMTDTVLWILFRLLRGFLMCIRVLCRDPQCLGRTRTDAVQSVPAGTIQAAQSPAPHDVTMPTGNSRQRSPRLSTPVRAFCAVGHPNRRPQARRFGDLRAFLTTQNRLLYNGVTSVNRANRGSKSRGLHYETCSRAQHNPRGRPGRGDNMCTAAGRKRTGVPRHSNGQRCVDEYRGCLDGNRTVDNSSHSAVQSLCQGAHRAARDRNQRRVCTA